MPSRSERKYTRTINNVLDEVGVDIATDEKKSKITSIDNTAGPLATDIEEIGGQAQSAVDVAQRIDAIFGALQAQSSGELRTRILGPDGTGTVQQAVVEALDTALATGDTGVVTYLTRALSSIKSDQLRVDLQNNNAGTLPVEQQTPVALEDETSTAIAPSNPLATEQQSPVGVEDSTGTQVDPAVATAYLDSQTVGYDLVGSGDLVIGPAPVERGTAVVIAATSTDTNAFSISVQWEDDSGNVFQSESATDIGLDNVTEDYARLVRKSPQVEVTITDESGATQNIINAHADTER